MEELKVIKLEDFEFDQAVNIKFENTESVEFDLKSHDVHGIFFFLIFINILVRLPLVSTLNIEL